MSFDIFLQRFAVEDRTGAAGSEHGDRDHSDEQVESDAAVAKLLEPLLTDPPDAGFARIETADGSADVHGIGSASLMINHNSGDHIWQLMYEIARTADYAVMPVGCPACVATDAVLQQLPEELRGTAVLVTSGADIQHAVLTA